MNAPFSGSSIDRVIACAPAALLPATRIILEAGIRGTAIHEYLASVPVLGRDVALEQVAPEYRAACEAINLSSLPASRPEDWAQEVAFAYDVATDTARELHRGGGRDYSDLRPGEIPGTVDLLGVTEDAVVVPDYKTGRLARRERAAKSGQLRFYGLGLARRFGKSRVIIAKIHLLEDGESYWDVAEMDAVDLDVMALQVRQTWDAVAAEAEHLATGAPARVTEGDHCTYCPAFGNCPAKVGLALALGTGGFAVPTLDATTAPLVLERLAMAQKVLEAIQKALDTYAEASPFRALNGKVYGLSDKPTESINAAKAIPVLAERFGASIAEVGVRRDPTIIKKGLTDIARAWAKQTPGATIGAVERAALEALRTAGAMDVKLSRKVRLHDEELAVSEEIAGVTTTEALPPPSPLEPTPSEPQKADAAEIEGDVDLPGGVKLSSLFEPFPGDDEPRPF